MDCGSKTLPDKPGRVAVPGARRPLLREVFALVRRYRADGVKLNVETKVEAGAPAETAPAGAVLSTRVGGDPQRPALKERPARKQGRPLRILDYRELISRPGTTVRPVRNSV